MSVPSDIDGTATEAVITQLVFASDNGRLRKGGLGGKVGFDETAGINKGVRSISCWRQYDGACNDPESHANNN